MEELRVVLKLISWFYHVHFLTTLNVEKYTLRWKWGSRKIKKCVIERVEIIREKDQDRKDYSKWKMGSFVSN